MGSTELSSHVLKKKQEGAERAETTHRRTDAQERRTETTHEGHEGHEKVTEGNEKGMRKACTMPKYLPRTSWNSPDTYEATNRL